MTTAQEQFWAGPEGDEYQARNANALVGGLEANVALFSRILAKTMGVKTLIEFGSGAGLNLRAIHRVMPFISLYAVEINEGAVMKMPQCVLITMRGSVLEMPPLDLPCDLAMTKGLLIHIAPADLPRAYATLYQASTRYILMCEYYCPNPRMIPYRGQPDRLWARDFPGEMLAAYPDLRLIDYGFVSKLDPHPQDDISWFLLEKG